MRPSVRGRNALRRRWLERTVAGALLLAGTLIGFQLLRDQNCNRILNGLHPEARKPLLSLIQPWQLSGTLENQPASAGLHLPDPPRRTTAAVDLDVTGLADREIRSLLEALGRKGFAAWYRKPGQEGWPHKFGAHIHAVWAEGPLKPALRRQIQDYLHGRNGLKNHADYHYFAPSRQASTAVQRAYGNYQEIVDARH